MKRLFAILVLSLVILWPQSPKAESCSEMFARTNWNSIAAGIYGNYIFYKTSMDKPNIFFFQQAIRQCLGDLNEGLHGGELDWQDAALTRFKNLVAIALVGLYEMNARAATGNFTSQALEIVANLREAYAAMREKDIFSASETDFMRGFRKLEASGIIAKTCANELASRKFLAGKSAIQLEYVKFNDNIQHALFASKAGARGCSWAGNCVRMSGSRIKCNGTLGSQGGFEAVEKNGRLVISDQNLDAQCGYPAMAGVYELR